MATTVTLKPNAIDISGSTSGTTTLQATAVAGTTTLTLPAATDTLVGRATTDTLTNKTLTGAAMNGTLGATTPSTVAATSISASTTLGVTGVATFSAGTAAAPAITTTGDTNTGIFFPAADTIAFAEGGAESMRLDSAGNMGLGVTPSAWNTSQWTALEGAYGGALAFYKASNVPVTVLTSNAYNDGSWKYKTTDAALQYEMDGNGGTYKWYQAPSGTAGNSISFTQAMTLDASGRLGIGTTSPASRLEVIDTASTLGQVRIGGSGVGTLFAGMTAGSIGFLHSNTGTLAFGTSTSDNNLVERARIDSSGNLLVGASSFADGSNVFRISGSTISSGSSTTGSRTRLEFNSTGLGTVGSISTSGSVTSYNVTSDQRLKENIQDADSASSLIDSLKVRKFDWKSDNSHQRYGFIAQELVSVAPEAVHQPTDTEQMMAVDYSKLVPMLVKEIQSLRKRLAALESA